MARVSVTADVRTDLKRSVTRNLRAKGMVPATVYGKQLDGPVSVQFPFEDLVRCVKNDTGINTIIDLTINGGPKSEAIPVVVKDIQRDPRSRKILHVDFQTVSMDTKLTASVPVHLVGEAVGVKTQGGQIEHIHRELVIRCLPGTVPPAIEIDISNLAVGDSIKIGDINLEGIELEGPADDPIVLCRGRIAAAAEEEAGVIEEAQAGEPADAAGEEAAE